MSTANSKLDFKYFLQRISPIYNHVAQSKLSEISGFLAVLDYFSTIFRVPEINFWSTSF